MFIPFEPDVMDQMPFPAHAQALQQPPGRRVERVAHGGHAARAEPAKDIIQQAGSRFRGLVHGKQRPVDKKRGQQDRHRFHRCPCGWRQLRCQ